jgi:hypothetical protein
MQVGSRRLKRTLACFAGLPIASVLATGTLPGQQAVDFDLGRAYQMDSTFYAPFRVETTYPLVRALKEGELDEQTSLLVMDHPEAGLLALVTDQMAYHHVAQGEIAGVPWMVSF